MHIHHLFHLQPFPTAAMALPRRQRRRDWLGELCSEGPNQVTTKHFILSSSGKLIFQIQKGFDFQKCHHEHFYFPEILKSEFWLFAFSVCDWCHWHRARKSERFISYPSAPRKKHHYLHVFLKRAIFKACLASYIWLHPWQRQTVASKVQTQSLLKVLCGSINLRTVSIEQCSQPDHAWPGNQISRCKQVTPDMAVAGTMRLLWHSTWSTLW